MDDPDEILPLKIDRRTLSKGTQYRVVGFEGRQVFDIKISRHVTEYRAEILEDNQGKRFMAQFPDGVSRPVQYGNDDHWKAYYQYECVHSLCNAHHLRELERAWEQDASIGRKR